MKWRKHAKKLVAYFAVAAATSLQQLPAQTLPDTLKNKYVQKVHQLKQAAPADTNAITPDQELTQLSDEIVKRLRANITDSLAQNQKANALADLAVLYQFAAAASDEAFMNRIVTLRDLLGDKHWQSRLAGARGVVQGALGLDKEKLDKLLNHASINAQITITHADEKLTYTFDAQGMRTDAHQVPGSPLIPKDEIRAQVVQQTPRLEREQQVRLVERIITDLISNGYRVE